LSCIKKSAASEIVKVFLVQVLTELIQRPELSADNKDDQGNTDHQ
jgi:hypothetical protein